MPSDAPTGTLFGQVFVLDAGAPLGLSASRGAEVELKEGETRADAHRRLREERRARRRNPPWSEAS